MPPRPHAGVPRRQLNQELLKEEEGLTAARGLVTTAPNPSLADNQLFLVYITDSIRKTYDAKMLQLVTQVCLCVFSGGPRGRVCKRVCEAGGGRVEAGVGRAGGRGAAARHPW